ncbi:alpha/beta hydrolase fold domain-containing protein [Frigoribacterium sp. CFBP 13729]|uniref:alpha/beta hydrolase n=1 Tax=unclassified Frigoribacterium TaxID=2627005 RepID=UPI001786671B|nr:alpha/beta hydrolase fold domain-containing protein [Frigoribacterium sp. CFBP 8766]MBD8610049.1 alpha/beta hydrolase fold domain-containing protein [Frigoribacterium sp. CFBP 13729]
MGHELQDEDTRAGSVPVRWYEPGRRGQDDRTPGPTLLWLHGGGFFRGSLDIPEAHEVATALAGRGLRVATAGYRLAPPPGLGWARSSAVTPRARFPAALDDVTSALEDVLARSPHGVVLGGASAGACLAAAATLRALDEGVRPVGAVFAYGFFHGVHPRAHDPRQRSQRHRRVTHAPWALDAMNRGYAGSRRTLGDRLAFPGGHDVGLFPRTLVVNAEHDNMRASGDLFASELAASGVDVEHHVLAGTRHAFLNRPDLVEFTTTTSLIADWMLSPDAATRGRPLP